MVCNEQTIEVRADYSFIIGYCLQCTLTGCVRELLVTLEARMSFNKHKTRCSAVYSDSTVKLRTSLVCRYSVSVTSLYQTTSTDLMSRMSICFRFLSHRRNTLDTNNIYRSIDSCWQVQGGGMPRTLRNCQAALDASWHSRQELTHGRSVSRQNGCRIYGLGNQLSICSNNHHHVFGMISLSHLHANNILKTPSS